MGQGKKRNSFGPAALFLFLLIRQALPLVSARHPIELRFRGFTTDDGLSSNQASVVFVDRNGFLWVGTGAGLNCYDGYSFRQYHHQPGDGNSLSCDEILAMHDDCLGRLWVITEKGLDILDPHSGQVTRLGISVAQLGSGITWIKETRRGEMWISWETKLLRMESTSGRILPLPEPLRSGPCPITKIFTALVCEDNQDNLWIISGTGDCGAFRFSPATGRLDHFQAGKGSANELLGNFVYDICQDKDGYIWIVNSAGLNRFDPAMETIRHFPLPGSQGRSDDYFTSMRVVADPSGWIWLATNQGIILFDSKSETYTFPLRFRAESRDFDQRGFFLMSRDKAGNIWMGSRNNGICCFSPRINQFHYIGSDPDPRLGLRDSIVNCLLEDRSGILWIGTQYSGLSSFNPATSEFVHFQGLPAHPRSGLWDAHSVYALCEENDGDLWIGATSGLFRYECNSGKFLRIDLPSEVDPDPFHPRRPTSIQKEEPDTLWISSNYEGVFRLDTKSRASTLFKAGEFASAQSTLRWTSFIRNLFLDRSRALWISTGNGLHCLDGQNTRIRHFLAGAGISGVAEDRNGNFWAGMDEGVVLLDRLHGTSRLFSKKNGLDAIRNGPLIEDNDGFIWTGTNRGLARFDPRRESFHNFDASDGASIGGALSAIRCRDGNIVFGGRNGMVIFDPRQAGRLNTHIPPMVFTALRIGDREKPLHEVFSQRDQAKETGRVTLRPGDRMLSVEFAALDFSAPEKNRYAFRLEEQGDTWNDLGTRRQLTFSNLAVGTHTLRVKGSNNDGVWNETGVALQIMVLPHFWQTWWFKVLCLLLLAGIVLAIIAVCRIISSLRRIAKPPNLDEIFNKYKISHREQEILHLVIQGKSNREMENELFISVPTVKRHLANIYEKIGVSSRLQLINFLQGRKPKY